MEEQNSINSELNCSNSSNDGPNSDAKTGRGWIPFGETLEFAGRKIPGGVYFGNPEELDCTEQERQNFHIFFIDPTKPVAEKGGPEFDNSLDSHDYGRMSPECRANYLDWLAGGRPEADCEHYPRLYCTCLKHRYSNTDNESWEKMELTFLMDELALEYRRDEKIAEIVGRFSISDIHEMLQKEGSSIMDPNAPAILDSLISGKLEDPTVDPFGEYVKNPEHLKFLKAIVECADKSSDGKKLDVNDIRPILTAAPDWLMSINVSEIPRFNELFQKKLDENFPNGFSIKIKDQELAKAIKSKPVDSKFPAVWLECVPVMDVDDLFELVEEFAKDQKE